MIDHGAPDIHPGAQAGVEMGGVCRVSGVRDRTPGEVRGPTASPEVGAASADVIEEAIVHSALAVLIQRAGGAIEYTESEFQGVHDRHGAYRIVGDIDSSGPGQPRIKLRIDAASISSKDGAARATPSAGTSCAGASCIDDAPRLRSPRPQG